jgi:phospholipase C
MNTPERRRFLINVGRSAGAAATLSAFPPAIRKALAISADRRTGTLQDVDHIVILTQENRSFDHYFGGMNGVRGFADRFPIPVPASPGITGKTAWIQPNQVRGALPRAVAPFALNTRQRFRHMRVEGTPHTWPDAQAAWNHGRMNAWPRAKYNHAMAYFDQRDMPFQYALANAFTLCDAYHCSFQGGTNPNRLFLWTGTNDPLGKGNGPATYNDYDWFDADYGDGGYAWTTYPERLQAAGITWQVYENMEDNFTDNPLAGFKTFRDAWHRVPGASAALRQRGASTRDLDLLKQDVLAHRLPQVSWIVATATGSEHPGPSSPAQGADYTSRVLDALTAGSAVWARTVLIVNFDENDGFFDHMPPPAVPSYVRWHPDRTQAALAGQSSVDTTGEYHEVLVDYHADEAERALLHRPYGLGPRVPMYAVSPWSKGGWVNSQVFDHTSVIRFIEQRFGVMEPNISAWRRAVCGDLTSAFNFADPDDAKFFSRLPQTLALSNRAGALLEHSIPATPTALALPTQAAGARPSRALPYQLQVAGGVKGDASAADGAHIVLRFSNSGAAAAVFHVYDRLHLNRIPSRYTVAPGDELHDSWKTAPTGAYDLWVLGPNGFHRHYTGNARRALDASQANPEVELTYDVANQALKVTLINSGGAPCTFQLRANAYFEEGPVVRTVVARATDSLSWSLRASARWYDFSVTAAGHLLYSRRFAGRLENGEPSISDPAMAGTAVDEQWRVGA